MPADSNFSGFSGGGRANEPGFRPTAHSRAIVKIARPGGTLVLALARQFGGYAVKRRVGLLANGPNGGQTYDDDQGQHNGVLNRCGAVF